MREADLAYFHRREADARVAADKASCEAARTVHLAMADAYRMRLEVLHHFAPVMA